MPLESQAVEGAVSRWLSEFVVGLNLCPFAAQAITQQTVRIVVSEAQDEDTLLAVLQDEVLALAATPATETTLLVHPLVLADFLDYNDFIGVCERLLLDMNAEGEFQIAGFHPQYQFAGTAAEDAENYANRSPYPLLHILRESSVTEAVASHPDTNEIPERNSARLEALGAATLRQRWQQLLVATGA